jgi:uncharacterized membrane protein
LKRFPWQKTAEFFTKEEKEFITEAVRYNEQRTSGEIRIFVESHCRYVDAIDRAAEIFFGLQMERTEKRNAVLVYVAMKDRQLAVFADEGIYQKLGKEYWHNEVNEMIANFNRDDYAAGIRQCVSDIGEALHTYFPYDEKIDKNELPDEIVFGH